MKASHGTATGGGERSHCVCVVGMLWFDGCVTVWVEIAQVYVNKNCRFASNAGGSVRSKEDKNEQRRREAKCAEWPLRDKETKSHVCLLSTSRK